MTRRLVDNVRAARSRRGLAAGWLLIWAPAFLLVLLLVVEIGNVMLAKTAHCWPTGLPDLQDECDALRAAAKDNTAKAGDDPTRLEPGMFYNKTWLQKY